MRASRYELDMCQGSIFKNTIRFAIPLMLTTFLSLFYHAADIIVVSRWTGSEAMASVGATTALINLITNFFVGFSIGVSIIVSRKYGARDNDGLHRVIHTSMLFACFLGVLALVTGVIFSRPLLKIMGTPEGKVLDGAVRYMRIIFLGKPAVLLYSFGSAILRAVGDTKRSLYISSISGLLNVVLNLILVIVFKMGVAGVAIATIVSQYVSLVIQTCILIRADGVYKLCLNKLKIYKKELVETIKIGLPTGLQNVVFNFANTIIQSAVNSFGAAAMAGNAAGANIESFAYGIKNAFYQATVTGVSQNYGAKNEKRMKKCVSVSLMCMIVGGLALGVIMAVFARPLLSIYITDSPEAMNCGVIRVIITALPYFLSGIMEIYTGYLRGLGYATTSTVNSFIGVCGLRILWILAIFPLNRTLGMLYLCWPLSWLTVIILHNISLIFLKKKAIERMYSA